MFVRGVWEGTRKGGKDDDNLEDRVWDKEICIVFNVDDNYQQCKL